MHIMAPSNSTPLKIMKKEYLTAISILFGAIIIAKSTYLGTFVVMTVLLDQKKLKRL